MQRGAGNMVAVSGKLGHRARYCNSKVSSESLPKQYVWCEAASGQGASVLTGANAVPTADARSQELAVRVRAKASKGLRGSLNCDKLLCSPDSVIDSEALR